MFDRRAQVEFEGAVVAGGAVDRDPVGGAGDRVEADAPALLALAAPASLVGDRVSVSSAEPV